MKCVITSSDLSIGMNGKVGDCETSSIKEVCAYTQKYHMLKCNHYEENSLQFYDTAFNYICHGLFKIFVYQLKVCFT